MFPDSSGSGASPMESSKHERRRLDGRRPRAPGKAGLRHHSRRPFLEPLEERTLLDGNGLTITEVASLLHLVDVKGVTVLTHGRRPTESGDGLYPLALEIRTRAFDELSKDRT